MSLRLPTRTLAPVLVLAVLAGIVATFVVARPPSSATDDAPKIIRPKLAKPKPAPVKKAVPAKKAGVVRKAKPVAKAPVKKAAPAPVAKAKPVPVAKAAAAAAAPAPAPAAVETGGLPRPLVLALSKSPVVVVSLYDPDAAVDGLAVAEARAGARDAGVGFVAINVFAEAHSRPLLELLGALENPSVLVYSRPNTLSTRIGGFADSQTVAQAAANARR
jgi:hypothetical protein